jgi:hypothetical protein
MKKEWKNLLKEQCPLCGYDLDVVENDFRICQNDSCDFAITKWAYNEQKERLDREAMRREMPGYGHE